MNSEMILRSPTLAGGGPVHVVRLCEMSPYASGGLAKPAGLAHVARPAKPHALTLHLSPSEFSQLQKKWGAPRSNPVTRVAEYHMPAHSLRSHFAEGGSTTPEYLRTRVANPVVDYNTYGMGPEAKFYNDNVVAAPPMYATPTTPAVPKAQSGSNTAANIAGLGALLVGGSKLADVAGYGGTLSQGANAVGNLASGNLLGAAKSGLGLYRSLTGGPSFADYSSGAAVDDALKQAGITDQASKDIARENGQLTGSDATAAGTSPGLFGNAKSTFNTLGDAANLYSGINEGGTKGYGAAGAAAADLAASSGLIGGTTASGVGALGNALSGNYVGAAKNLYNLYEGATAGTSAAGAGAGTAGAAEGAGAAGAGSAGAGGALASYAGPAMAAYAAYFLGNGLLSKPEGIALSASDRSGMNNEVLRSKLNYTYAGKDANGEETFLLPNGGKVPFSTLQQLGNLVPGAVGATTRDKRGGDDSEYQKALASLADPSGVAAYTAATSKNTPEAIQAGLTAQGGSAANGWQTNNDPFTEEEKANNNALAAMYGYARGGALRHGASDYEAPPEQRPNHVRGPGTGRSDSIPAQLSDGEYVLTAEDVSLLGDGSNDAGAKRLDEMRTHLRKHKGSALSHGKISPNAKAPMQYMKGHK